MTPAKRLIADLACIGKDGQAIRLSEVVALIDKARAMSDRDRASKQRRRVKSLPRRKVEINARVQRDMDWIGVKEKVRARCHDYCEACGTYTMGSGEGHHLISGALRREMEAPETVAWTCWKCHGRVHGRIPGGALDVLRNIHQRAGLWATDAALDALQRRIDKIERMNAQHPESRHA